jgi:hypothetical protein
VRRRPLLTAGAAALGVLGGAVLSLAVQNVASPMVPPDTGVPAAAVVRSEAPETFLAWIPRGLPPGFVRDVRALPQTGEVTVVAEDLVWLRRSWSDAGELKDHPQGKLRIPLDAAAVDPTTFASFLPTPDRSVMVAVANGQGILGATSALLRGLGPGATLELGNGERIRIAAVLPDELIGAAELVVSRDTGARIGIDRDRYVLLHPAPGYRLRSASLRQRFRPLLPATLGVNRHVQVRAPGETPFLRAADAVLPPVMLKSVFGEFAARPDPKHRGSLRIDPAWVQANIVTTMLPVIGTVTCHRAIVPQLRGAMEQLKSEGLQRLVRSYNGCFVPRFIGRDPSNMISNHSWGVAFDINLVGNYRGQPPHQDPRLVDTLEHWGFMWGGRWLVPDGSHFEYHRAATG